MAKQIHAPKPQAAENREAEPVATPQEDQSAREQAVALQEEAAELTAAADEVIQNIDALLAQGLGFTMLKEAA